MELDWGWQYCQFRVPLSFLRDVQVESRGSRTMNEELTTISRNTRKLQRWLLSHVGVEVAGQTTVIIVTWPIRT